MKALNEKQRAMRIAQRVAAGEPRVDLIAWLATDDGYQDLLSLALVHVRRAAACARGGRSGNREAKIKTLKYNQKKNEEVLDSSN